jgi:putative transposase
MTATYYNVLMLPRESAAIWEKATQTKQPDQSLPREEISVHRATDVGILQEPEASAKTAKRCCKHSISPATFYKSKAQFGGTAGSDDAKLRKLENEIRRLKRLLADSATEIDALKLIASGNF